MASGYTRFVKIGKHSLWLFVALILAVLFWIASDNTGDNGRRIVFTNVQKQADNNQNIMVNPRYQGLDKNNLPFTVLADTAIQQDPDNIALKTVRGDMLQRNGKWVAINSVAGMLNTQAKQLQLTNGVEMFYEGGYDMRTDHAHVDIAKGAAYGDSHVEGQGPLGTLVADSFTVTDHGQIIHFDGNVKVKIYRDK